MGRIGELDLPERLAPYAPAWVTQILLAFLVTGGAAIIRVGIDIIAPTAAPFALTFPAVLIATLFGRWPAGIMTASLCILYFWYFALTPMGGFRLGTSKDGAAIAVALGCALTIVLIAELFRRAVRQAAAERDVEIAERDLFLEEFDHRVKNNFTLVASLLEMQRRRAGNGETADALAGALARVESIARAHRHLYRGAAAPGTVDMAAYLHELCTALSEALFLRGAITLECESEPAALPRDRAVSVGLIINELVTNAAKHAFAGRDHGAIHVRLEAHAPGWRLTVRDDGCGTPAPAQTKGREGGLGRRLIDGFARQARGKVTTKSGPGGTTVVVDLEA
ncbi:sensor histidine kinase [Sphingomonas sp. M1-B02]|uniref:sensor histidine kinase n=1 Tax=Sphingomonas sp. M1-B02 TaxID=3114300 RepID=UPI00223EE293|nr:histidine kinase dimerization/phosphoacceptor domain -containing protein [Sphingomonas sp. S6-11]UZK65661.1 DUF4118 domain-containing protein [Sphingomonas sp. S6-11]